MTSTMTRRLTLTGGGGVLALGAATLALAAPSSPAATRTAATTTQATVRISGGHATDPRDNGRPVKLVAAALGVPAEVFRTAFSVVDPAAAGQAPDPPQVRANKAALLRVLAPYGVTNESLDAASDYYRYNASAGEVWRRTAARATAVVRNGHVVSIRLVKAGAGYSSTPTVTVRGYPKAKVRVKLSYGRNLAANGAIRSLRLIRG
jgi:hypothetical protein